MNLNNVSFFEGRISSDPQFGSFQGSNGTVETAMFRVAVERPLSSEQRQKVKNGDKTIKTADFIPCKLTGARVAFLKQYFQKGSPVKLACHYTEYKTVDAQTGADKYGHMFEVDDISFVVGGNSGNNNGGGNNNNHSNSNYNNNNNNSNYNNTGNRTQPQPSNDNFQLFDEGEMPF